jgi:hypothetical protein
LYAPYFETDLANPEFVTTVLAGLRDSPLFAANALQLEANYHAGITGEDIRRALVDAGPPRAFPLVLDGEGIPFLISTAAERESTLALLVQEFSIQVTSAIVVAEETGAHPVATDAHFARLLALRSNETAPGPNSTPAAPYLGLEFTRAVIPDEALNYLTPADIIRYRRASRDAYDAWEIEVNKAAATIDEISGPETQARVQQLITTELNPTLMEFRRAMIDARETLFADLLKSVTKWQLPTLTIAYLTGRNVTETIAAFAAAALAGAAPPVIDYVTSRRRAVRNSPASYLVGIAEAAEDFATME